MLKTVEWCIISPKNIRVFEIFHIIIYGSKNVWGTFGTPCTKQNWFLRRLWSVTKKSLQVYGIVGHYPGSVSVVEVRKHIAKASRDHCTLKHSNCKNVLKYCYTTNFTLKYRLCTRIMSRINKMGLGNLQKPKINFVEIKKEQFGL